MERREVDRNDIPDFNNAAPGSGTNLFIMQPEGLGRLFAIDKMAEGPFLSTTSRWKRRWALTRCTRMWSRTRRRVCMKKMRCAWVRRSSFRTWARLTASQSISIPTKHALLNAIAQPEQFVEISETLAAAKGIANGDYVKVSSKRGFIRAVAVVTRRLRTLHVNGQQVETVGIPIHWGFEVSRAKAISPIL